MYCIILKRRFCNPVSLNVSVIGVPPSRQSRRARHLLQPRPSFLREGYEPPQPDPWRDCTTIQTRLHHYFVFQPTEKREREIAQLLRNFRLEDLPPHRLKKAKAEFECIRQNLLANASSRAKYHHRHRQVINA